jgi:branched-chain amino acid aminotransferase
MSESIEYAWLDGKLGPINDISVHPLSYTLNYGFGCFEGVRAYLTAKGSALFRLDCHLERLFRSAALLGITIPFDLPTLRQAHIDVLTANHLDSAYLRPLCYIGEGLGLHSKNLKTHLFIAARPWGAYMGAEKLTKGLTLKTSSYVRNHPNSVPTKAKATANYLNGILALREAQAANCDEALMLDYQGFVSECSAQNIFIIKQGTLITPDTSSALEGITRDSILTLAHDLGFAVEIRRMTRDEIVTADEVFITGTAAEVTPIVALDYRPIANGLRGAITERLQTAFFNEAEAKDDAKHPQWLIHY